MPSSSDESLDVDEDVLQRFEEARQDTKNDHTPPMDQSLFLSALLDTREAVRNGHYDNQPESVELNGVVQDSVNPETVKSGHLAAEEDDE